MTMTLIETKTLGSGSASIEFTSIPQNATDLVLLFSGRRDQDSVEVRIQFNGDTGSNYTTRRLFGGGGAAASDNSSTTFLPFYGVVNSNATSNVFSNGQFYISNYTGSTTKTVSADTVTENNGIEAYTQITAGLWNNTAAITSILLIASSGSFTTNTSASLYKVTKGSSGGVVVS
jgi:hypothetical protein